MEIHPIGIDPGKTVFHLVGLNPRGEVCGAQEVLAQATAALHGPFHEIRSRYNFSSKRCCHEETIRAPDACETHVSLAPVRNPSFSQFAKARDLAVNNYKLLLEPTHLRVAILRRHK